LRGCRSACLPDGVRSSLWLLCARPGTLSVRGLFAGKGTENPHDGPGWGYDQYRPVGPNRDAGTVAIYFAACADAEPDHRAAADTGPDSVGQGFVTEVGVMSYHAHRDQDRNPSHSEQTRVRSMVPFVLSAVAAIALIAVLSPRFREVHHAPAVYAEAIAPGPIPSTERRLSQTPIK
jgi:hypothetical protein